MEKEPALPSSYRPLSLLETIGKLFEEIPLNRFQNEVSEPEQVRDKQSVFDPGMACPCI